MKVAIIALMLAALAPVGAQQPTNTLDRNTSLRVFLQRVDAYAALHRRLEAPLLTLTQTKNMMKNYVARQLLAGAIRKARGQAQQGDIFRLMWP